MMEKMKTTLLTKNQNSGSNKFTASAPPYKFQNFRFYNVNGEAESSCYVM